MNGQNCFPLLYTAGDTPKDPGTPALSEGVQLDEIRLALQEPHAPAGSFRDPGEHPESLPDQRWGIIAPAGPEGNRLLALIEPLRKRREEQQGHPVQIYRIPENLKPDPTGKTEPFSRWKEQVLETGPMLDRPLYLLFLGDLHQIPIELQQYVATDALAGRLAFRDEEDYEAYVDKVLRWERKPPTVPKARALFYTAHDGTAATTIGYHSLMGPMKKAADEDLALGYLKASEVVEVGSARDYSIDKLLEEAARSEPTMLFSMSHGLGAPRSGWKSVDEQRERQGSMCLGGGQYLEASGLRNRPFLPGGAWFFFACLGAGTPSRSTFHHWLKKLQDSGKYGGRLESVLNSLPKEGEAPFISALPQAALANPNGPLAVFGHIDLAWTFGIQSRHTGRGEVQRFLEPMYEPVKGRRVGLGLKQLLNGYHSANVDLTQLISDEEAARQQGRPFLADAARMAHLWMVRQDLIAYVLLGDPAVRLSLAASQAVRQAPLSAALDAMRTPPGVKPRSPGPALHVQPEQRYRAEDFSEPATSAAAPVRAPTPAPPQPVSPGVQASTPPTEEAFSSDALLESMPQDFAQTPVPALRGEPGASPQLDAPAPRPLSTAPSPQTIEQWSMTVSVDAMERAVLRLAALRRRLAEEIGVTMSDLRKWELLYHQAGRAALDEGRQG